MSNTNLSSPNSPSPQQEVIDSSSASFPDNMSYVKLNVGGHLSYTTVATLISRSTWFQALFSGRTELHLDEDGWILIDRCGKHFDIILNYLRDGCVCLPTSKRDLGELLQEVRFYCIEELCQLVEKELELARQSEEDFISSQQGELALIYIVKCPQMERKLLSHARKPIVKLKMNRSNNVFSYTTNSHDVLLRHIECLEKYALMFRHTVIFIRDVRNEKNEVCEWSFYYRGCQLKKIDCSSIHYSSEARLTKVEFPESKIHEEMLNLVSLATRNVSDQDLWQMTMQKQASVTMGIGGGGVLTPVGGAGGTGSRDLLDEDSVAESTTGDSEILFQASFPSERDSVAILPGTSAAASPSTSSTANNPQGTSRDAEQATHHYRRFISAFSRWHH